MTSNNKGTVSFSISGRVGTIEFYHPKGNSLPGSILKELATTIKKAGESSEIESIVIRSKGDGAFCAGASFDELISIEDTDQGKEFFMGFANVINAMRTCPKMIVVRVHGKTVGGGIGIAAAADYCIAHKSASIKLSELALGIGPFVVGPAVGRKIGVSAFSTMALDPKNWYSAQWAHNKGLYSKLFDSFSDLDESVQEISENLASFNPEAMRQMKEIFWQSTGHWSATLEQRAEISGKLVTSDFTKNFIENFKKL